VVFKLPAKGHSESWGYNGLKYTSSWTTILNRGDRIDAIKVVQYTPKWNTSTIEYYVKEYGLVETVVASDKSTVITDKFHQRLFDEDLYTDDLSRNSKFNYLKAENIFTEPFEYGYQESKDYFYLAEPNKKSVSTTPNVNKSNTESSLSLTCCAIKKPKHI